MEDQVDFVKLLHTKDGWVVKPQIKHQAVSMDSLGDEARALMDRVFDYSDEAHDAAREVFPNAMIGESVQSLAGEVLALCEGEESVWVGWYDVDDNHDRVYPYAALWTRDNTPENVAKAKEHIDQYGDRGIVKICDTKSEVLQEITKIATQKYPKYKVTTS